MTPSVVAVAAAATVVVSTVVAAGVSAVIATGVPAAAVMSATRAASAVAAAGHRDPGDGGRAVAGVGRRVGVAISHGRCGGQRHPQQDRDRQQLPGTGSVHPGIMGPRARAHAGDGLGSPERVERRP
uniref:Secreted protein n=1 Tax=Streptomyces sp. NBC_00049 TaxID=2903617 RepID=A0AAU2K0V8_9ACTN